MKNAGTVMITAPFLRMGDAAEEHQEGRPLMAADSARSARYS